MIKAIADWGRIVFTAIFNARYIKKLEDENKALKEINSAQRKILDRLLPPVGMEDVGYFFRGCPR